MAKLRLNNRPFDILFKFYGGQDERNPVFWLVFRAGTNSLIGPSYPLGISRVGPVRKISLFANAKILY